jgi:hypothetical protein
MRRTLISWTARDFDPDRSPDIVLARPADVRYWARLTERQRRMLREGVGGGSPYGYQNLLTGTGPASADGPTLTAAAEASCIPTDANTQVYAGVLNPIGKTLQFTMAGRFSTAATPGTGQLRIRNGSSAGTAGVILFDTGALSLSVSAATHTWKASCILTVRAHGSGTSGNAMVIGEVSNLTGTLGSGARNMIPATAPAVTAGYDSTAAPFFNVTWTPSLATASFTVHQWLVEEMN